jgi:hypothetical protein
MMPLCNAVPGMDGSPSSSIMFPWLSTIASCYERFRFHKLGFTFTPSQSTTTSGRIYTAWDYDYDDNVAPTKPILMANKTCTEDNTWERFSLNTDPKELMRDQLWKYTNALSGRANFVEPRTAYCGFLMVATDCPANCVWDVRVYYDVEFAIPVVEPTSAADTFTGSTPASTPTVLPSLGAFGQYQPIVDAVGTLAASGIRRVTPGTAGVPPLALATPTFATTALDLLGVNQTKGALTASAKYTVTGSTPAAIMTAGQPYVEFMAFDSAGNQLGKYNDVTDNSATNASGAQPQSGTNTSGAALLTTIVCYLPKLFKLYQTARYIAPYLTNGSSLGAGTLATGLKYEV